MRRLVFTLLVTLLVLPAAALGGVRAAGDGTLAVKNAMAQRIVIEGRGTIFGHFDTATLTVVDYNPFDAKEPQVNGAEKTQLKSETTTVYKGSDVRFFFGGGRYKIILSGFGVSLSAVGRGTATLAGVGTADDGTFVVNGGKPQPLPSLIPVSTSFGAVTP
jgi:hypothetical protein